MTNKEFNKKIEIVECAVIETIAHSLEDIGITAGSSLWTFKREEARDYFIKRLNTLTKKKI